MTKFFKICGVLFFLGVPYGLSLLFSGASVNDINDVISGIFTSFASFALGMLFTAVSKLLKGKGE